MAKKGVIKSFFGSLLNVRKWSSYDDVKSSAVVLTNLVKDLYGLNKRNTTPQIESFSAAIQRLRLNENDIQQRTRYFLYYAICYFLVALALLAYTIYLMLGNGTILAVLVSFVLTALMLVYSFREHFWYMQMKKRKIGCTMKEWLAFVLGRAK